MVIPICTVPFVDEHGMSYSAEFAYNDTYSGKFSISYSYKSSTISITHFFEDRIWVGRWYSHCAANPALAIELQSLITAFQQANPELFI